MRCAVPGIVGSEDSIIEVHELPPDAIQLSWISLGCHDLIVNKDFRMHGQLVGSELEVLTAQAWW